MNKKGNPDDEMPDLNNISGSDLAKLLGMKTQEIRIQGTRPIYRGTAFANPFSGGQGMTLEATNLAEPAEEKKKPEMALIKIRVQHGSKQKNNMAVWNKDEKLLDIFYLNGFNPSLLNMQSKRIDDSTIEVSLDKGLVDHIKGRDTMFDLKSLGPSAQPLIELSSLTYKKHAVGHHICKYFIPAVPREMREDVGSAQEAGLLPQDYKYGNVPFHDGTCTHPDRVERDGGEVTECTSSANMPVCSDYVKEDGIPVEIRTKSRGTLVGLKLRTFNPYRGAIYTELFDTFGDRFSVDTEHNILPDKEDVDDNQIQSQSPLLRSKQESSVQGV